MQDKTGLVADGGFAGTHWLAIAADCTALSIGTGPDSRGDQNAALLTMLKR